MTITHEDVEHQLDVDTEIEIGRAMWRGLRNVALGCAKGQAHYEWHPAPGNRCGLRRAAAGEHLARCATAGREVDRLIWRLADGDYVEPEDVLVQLAAALELQRRRVQSFYGYIHRSAADEDQETAA